MELPLPAHDPGAHRGRAPGRGPRPGGLRTVRQAHPPRRVHLRPPRGVDAGAPLRPARPLRDHAGLPGLGWPDRAATGGRASRPVRPGGGGQYVPPHRRLPPRRRLHGMAQVLPGGGALPDRGDRQRRVRHRPVPRRGGGLRRAVPRLLLLRGGPPVPHPGPDLPGRPRRRGQPGGLEGPRSLRQALPHRLLRPGPHHRRVGPGPPGPHPRSGQDSPTPPSPEEGTSSRRTRVPSWPRWWWTSWAAAESPHRPQGTGRCAHTPFTSRVYKGSVRLRAAGRAGASPWSRLCTPRARPGGRTRRTDPRKVVAP